MQVSGPHEIRNVAVAGHSDTGKTTTVSALLYASGATPRQLKVDDGNTITDFDHQETERRISIGLAVAHGSWRGHKINLLDCPGYGIFFTETRAGLRAADAVILTVNGVSGVEVNTDKVWHAAEEIDLPLLVHLTKMDRERADFERTLANLQEHYGRAVLPIQVPIGSEAGFKGVVDLVTRKAYVFDRDGNGKGKEVPVPAEVADAVEEHHGKLVEAVAESNLELLEAYFEQGDLQPEDLVKGLRLAVRKRLIFPLTLGADLHGIGASALADAIVDWLPSPADRAFPLADGGSLAADPAAPAAALVFKTISDPFTGKVSIFRVVTGTLKADSTLWNPRLEDSGKIGQLLHLQGKQPTSVPELMAGDIGAVAKLKVTLSGDTLCDKAHPVRLAWIPVPEPAMSFALEPKSKGDEEKIGEALHKLMEEDLTLHLGRDPDTHELLLSGSDQLHSEITVARLKDRFNVEVILHPPKVPYRETITRAADGHGRHKKQTGGRGQFADCKIKMEPMPRGSDFEFADEIFGGSIPHNYRPAVEKGIQETRRRGYLAGFPVVDFKVRLLDGQYHDVDSSEMAFKIAGSLAFKDAMQTAKPTILEPLMKVEITLPEETMGDIMSDLSQRRGQPQGMEAAGGGQQVIKAIAPMSEMLNYAQSLRSITQGRASFHMEFSHYEEVPRVLQEKIIANAKKVEHDEE
jgi:elongation factor G